MSDSLPALPELETMKVLADDTRHALFVALRDAGESLTTRELSELVGLHPNTVRPHLERLRQVGLVESDTHGHGQVGRPRHQFRVVGPPSVPCRTPDNACVEAVVDHAQRLGFEPSCETSGEGVTVSFGACPFDDADLGLACALHEGLIEGVVGHFHDEAHDSTGAAVLEKFVARGVTTAGETPDGPCRAELRLEPAGIVNDPT